MNLKILFLLPAFLLITFLSQACQCVRAQDWDSLLNQVKKYHSAEAIFIGEIISYKGYKSHPDLIPDSYDITYRIEKPYKLQNTSDSTFTVRTRFPDCEHSFKIGQKWLVVANVRTPGFYNANICTPTGKFTEEGISDETAARFYKFLTEELPCLGKKLKLKHENSKTALTGKYKKSLPHGTFKSFDESGKLKSVTEYENGLSKNHTWFNTESGLRKQKSIIHEDRRFWTVQFFNEQGNLKSEITYLDPKRVEKTYFDNQVLRSEKIMHLEKGNRKEFITEYYPNGNLKEEGWTQGGEKTGKWIYGTEDGKTENRTYP